MQHALKPALLCLFGLLLPGCIKYYELSKTEFPQGKPIRQQKYLRTTYMRDINLYKEFTTLALLDVLWLSPEVQKYYADRHSAKCGKNSAMRQALQNQHADDARNWISFYVLADVRTRGGVPLNDKKPPWTFYLTINNTTTIEPHSIKPVEELDAEYQALFGTRANGFKTLYHLTFPAYELDTKPYLNMKKYKMTLTFAGPHHEGETTWESTQPPHSYKNNDEDFYWV